MTAPATTHEETDRPPLRQPSRRGPAAWEWLLLLAVLAGLAASAGRLLAVPMILGHDEAVYAVRAEAWLEHAEATSWAPHRAAGLPVLGVVVLALGGEATALRLVALAFAVALVVGVWLLARRLGGAVGAPVAAAVVAFSPPLLDHTALYLTDLPATALVVWLVVVVVREATRPGGPGPAVLWVAPLCAGAVWLRFGAAAPVLLVAVFAILLWPRTVLSGWRWVLASGAAAVALLWPLLAGAVEAFGTPWGRILYTAEVARPDDAGAALPTYLRLLPGDLAGIPAAGAMVVGVLGAAMLLLHRALTARVHAPPVGVPPAVDRSRPVALCVLVGLMHLVVMGASATADARFVFPSVALLSALGGAMTGLLAARMPRRAGPPSAAAATLALVAVGIGPTTAELVSERAAGGQRYETLRVVAESLDEQGAGDCVVLTGYVPQMEWLTDCDVMAFDRAAKRSPDTPLANRYMVLVRNGKRQPTGAALETLLDRAIRVGRWDLAEGSVGMAELYRLP